MNKRRIAYGVIGLIIIWAVLFGLASAVRVELGSTSLRPLDIAISGGLSIALVLLYFRQTQILDKQRELITHELNREVRMSHTETLRDRVRIWHGSPDSDISNPLKFEGPDLNIPQVTKVDIKSAPTGPRVPFPSEEDVFRVVPHRLKNDRYLEDLLDNHASELDDARERIKDLQEEFVTLRDEFSSEYNDAPEIDKTKYILKPTESFPQWIFEQVILIERDIREGIEDAHSVAKSGVERSAGHIDYDRAEIRITARENGDVIYVASMKSGDMNAYDECRDDIDEDTIALIREALDAIHDGQPYEKAREATDILDDAAEAVSELEQLLIEYEGKPIYSGDCEYLDEATV